MVTEGLSATAFAPTCTSSTRTAPPPSGSVTMTSSRHRDRPAGGALSSGRSRHILKFHLVCVAVGVVILVSGLSVLLVGYATPPRLEAFGEDELLFVDGRAVRFNRALDACKLGGAVLFCVGGAGVAAGLILLAACGQGGAKDELHRQRRFKERLAEIQASVPNSGDAKVPVTLSKVQNIQPGAEP
ncbi:neurensin-1 isoform X2 [Tachysurus fulvidraco]|uniref:neurensin-1 isoform X2 n=1 Tax=Tachysurus fulvidraco TaxID=1234273 RepID=UPI001FEDB0DF|nr:neurensin-1 isoform X2 [Tachysurus fulvidraco]XP_047666619.1 neurensin-1 isoform X2 [Tachysurus fulvidraco]